MPFSSASPVSSRVAAVFEFLPALARRHLATRVGARGQIQVLAPAPGVFTLVYQQRELCSPDVVEARIAQIRAENCGSDVYRLFWRNCSGRWTAYSPKDGIAFTGSIDECLSEIARDPLRCFWS